MRAICVSTISWLMLMVSGCGTGTAALSELQTLVQSSKSVQVTFWDYSADPDWKVPKQVSYEISSPSGLAGLIAGIGSMTDVEKTDPIALFGNPELTFRGAQGEILATLEVYYHGGHFEIGNRLYKGTLPNTDFYHQLLDESLSLSDSDKQNAPHPTFPSIREVASQSSSWRIMVNDRPTDGNYRYEISDLAIIQQFARLMTSSDELKLTVSAISAAPMVNIYFVDDKTAGSVTKVELGDRDFHAIIAKQRYTVLLKSGELYQRLINKNFEFPQSLESGDPGHLNDPSPADPTVESTLPEKAESPPAGGPQLDQPVVETEAEISKCPP